MNKEDEYVIYTVGGILTVIGLAWWKWGQRLIASFKATPESLTLTCDASDSVATSPSVGSIQSYIWDFGDGTATTGKQVSHMYQTGGEYKVTLYIQTDKGQTAYTTQTVTITEPEEYPTVANPKVWKVAVVVMENGPTADTPIMDTPEMLALVDVLKTRTASHFSEMTQGLGALDVSYPTVAVLGIDNDAFIASLREILPDEFDFIVIIPTMSTEGAVPNAGSVKNDIHGIGLSIYDRSATLGGWTMLQGTPHLPGFFADIAVAKAAGSSSYEAALSAYAHILGHEVSHRWLAWWKYMENGQVMTDHLIDPNYGVHYAFGIRTSGKSYFATHNFHDNGDGTWSVSVVDDTAFNIDLYMMGLIPPEQVVPTHLIVITGPAQNVNGAWTYPGYEKLITIDQVIEAMGARWVE